MNSSKSWNCDRLSCLKQHDSCYSAARCSRGFLSALPGINAKRSRGIGADSSNSNSHDPSTTTIFEGSQDEDESDESQEEEDDKEEGGGDAVAALYAALIDSHSTCSSEYFESEAPSSPEEQQGIYHTSLDIASFFFLLICLFNNLSFLHWLY